MLPVIPRLRERRVRALIMMRAEDETKCESSRHQRDTSERMLSGHKVPARKRAAIRRTSLISPFDVEVREHTQASRRRTYAIDESTESRSSPSQRSGRRAAQALDNISTQSSEDRFICSSGELNDALDVVRKVMLTIASKVDNQGFAMVQHANPKRSDATRTIMFLTCTAHNQPSRAP
jgi:hypothetical protein